MNLGQIFFYAATNFQLRQLSISKRLESKLYRQRSGDFYPLNSLPHITYFRVKICIAQYRKLILKVRSIEFISANSSILKGTNKC